MYIVKVDLQLIFLYNLYFVVYFEVINLIRNYP